MQEGNKIRTVALRLIITFIVGMFALFSIFPFVWMVSTSFKFEIDVLEFPIRVIPNPVNLNNYVRVWMESNFPRYYLNTIFVAVVSIAGDLIMTTTAGFAFAKLRFRGKNVVFALYLATMMVPIHVTILPRFILFNQLGIVNTHTALILPYMFNVFGVFLMRNFFESVPDELIEAAKIDGAGYFRTFTSIALPLMTGPIATLTLLQFTHVWNDYLSPLIFLHTDDMLTLTVGLQRFQESQSTNYALIMAGAVTALLPIIVVFILAQKFFIQSFATAGIKG